MKPCSTRCVPSQRLPTRATSPQSKTSMGPIMYSTANMRSPLPTLSSPMHMRRNGPLSTLGRVSNTGCLIEQYIWYTNMFLRLASEADDYKKCDRVQRAPKGHPYD